MRGLANVGRLGVKELRSLRYDPLLLFLIVYAFTFSVYSAAEDAAIDVRNASVGVVDEDRSTLSRRIRDALRPPYFREPELLEFGAVDRSMESGRHTFVLILPAELERDVLAGEGPSVQLDVDATAMSVAGRGAGYIETILREEVQRFLHGRAEERGRGPAVAAGVAPPRAVVRARFNPNLESSWFQGVIEVVNNITLLSIILAGAAVIREREHGTLEHLLVMPVRPTEIMLAKVWANGLVILVGALLSLLGMVRGIVGVPLELAQIAFFGAGAVLYLFSVTALGIFLATTARSMPQFGLLSIPVFVVMILLSGTFTPLDAIPEALRTVMKLAPSTHFVAFAKSVLFRGAGPAAVGSELLGVAATGSAFFAAALLRFRASVTAGQR